MYSKFLSIRAFPIINDILNPYIFGNVRCVINVSEHKYSDEIASLLNDRGIAMYHFPMNETEPDMGLSSILNAIKVIDEYESKGEKIILHCMCGNNRSRVVAESWYYHKHGTHIEDGYKGYTNHIFFNSAEGHLPPMEEYEALLHDL